MRKLILMSMAICLLIFTPMLQAQNKSLTIPAVAFTGQWDEVSYGTEGGYRFKDTVDGYLQAPVYLPEGAIIKGMRVFFWDNGPEYITVHLGRRNNFTNQGCNLFTLETPGASASLRYEGLWFLSAGSRKVNNQRFRYFINVFFHGTTNIYRLYAVQIIYE